MIFSLGKHEKDNSHQFDVRKMLIYWTLSETIVKHDPSAWTGSRFRERIQSDHIFEEDDVDV
jgi:hypothetical protein